VTDDQLYRADHLLELDPESDMREAFECFDEGDKGIINGQELRKWLGSVGDRMSDDEARRPAVASQLKTDRFSQIDAFLASPLMDKRGNFKYDDLLRMLRIADQEEQERRT
jgi:myosin regulatory light chain 12